jgi:hypothetical protein
MLNQSRYSARFKEPEDSLPCLQDPATGPYPEPEYSNPHSLAQFPQDKF